MSESNQSLFLYVGTANDAVYDGHGVGIYSYEFDEETGTATEVDVIECHDATFLAVIPRLRRLYAVCHVNRFEDQPGGGVVSFAIDDSGSLHQLNTQRVRNPHPAHIAISSDEKFILTASTLGGALTVFPLSPEGLVDEPSDIVFHDGEQALKAGDAKFGELHSDPGDRHAGFRLPVTLISGKSTAPHCVISDRSGGVIFVADLAQNSVYVHDFDLVRGKLVRRQVVALQGADKVSASTAICAPPSVEGPRMLVWHPSLPIIYSVNEYGSSVSVYEWKDGILSEVQRVPTLDVGHNNRHGAAGIAMHPNGRYLYVSNRGDNTIVIFDVKEDGKVEVRSWSPTGDHPRHLGLSPSGRFLLSCNTLSNDVTVHAVDAYNGDLVLVDKGISVPNPTCSVFCGSESVR